MVQGGPTQELTPSIVATNHMQQRINAYQNNYSGGLIEALKIAYPQVLSLVGDEFFQQLANNYVSHHHMGKENFQQYGDHFSQHIAGLVTENRTFEKVPYLADVAKSDWAIYLSYYAAKRSVFNFSGFSQLDNNTQQKAKLLLADDIHFVYSQWPLSHFWQFYQKSSQSFELNAPKTVLKFIVHRLEHKPQIEQLSEPQHLVLQAIIRGFSIEHLPESSAEYLPEFIANGWITGYRT